MSKLLITQAGDAEDWSVWITLPNHDPLRDNYGFVVGTGTTRDEAVASAVVDLEAAIEALQGPPGDIEERKTWI